jgi:uncharacterized membrane protein YgdD (TMEM256/DUF423 family)
MKRSGSQGWLTLAGVLGALGVALGAFGAHALKPVLPLQAMTIFETAVRYHLLHSLALLGCGLAMEVFPARAARLRWSAALFVVGIVLFSGSLYGLAVSDLTVLGLLTPLGGVAWVAAWGWFAWSVRRGRGDAA